jgi:hypothetical protein
MHTKEMADIGPAPFYFCWLILSFNSYKIKTAYIIVCMDHDDDDEAMTMTMAMTSNKDLERIRIHSRV